MTKESAIKPEYTGTGTLVLELTFKHILLIDVGDWNQSIIIEDGNMAVAWSGSLNFTVGRSGKTLMGSAASGEGLVNVYRGTGKVLMAPIQ